MKKYIVLFILLWAASGWCQKGITCSGATFAGSGVAAELSCTGATNQGDSTASTRSGDVNVGALPSNVWRASRIQYGGTTGTLCRIAITLGKSCSSTCDGTIFAYIYDDDGGETPHPSTSLTSCGSKVEGDIDTSPTEYTFNCNNVTLTNGNYYWIVLKRDKYDADDYIFTSYDSSCAIEAIDGSSDGSIWSTATTLWCLMHKIYIKE